MKITDFEIANDLQDGLQQSRMNKLQNIVLLAGPNGAGKSRLLSRLKRVLQYHMPAEQYEGRLKSIDNLRQKTGRRPENTDNYQLQIEEHERAIQIHNQIKLDSPISSAIVCVEFVPKNLLLEDCNTFSKSQLINAANNASKAGMDNLSSSTLAKIQTIQNQWWEVTHPASSTTLGEKARIIEQYENLKKYIFLFLKTELNRNTDGDATLFNLPLGKAMLSDGQKILLQFCIAIYAQADKLSDIILFMDEPENHLHPSVLISTLDQILKVAPNTQLWISTHSVPLLAHFDPSYIWFISDGKVEYAGKIPQKVLEGLLGNEEEILKLTNFLGLPAQMAVVQFAMECLLPPQTTSVTSDPQSDQIFNYIISSKTANNPLRVLDLGAGRGRLLNAFKDRMDTQELISSIDYRAFDPSSHDKTICESVITSVYGNSDNRYLNNEVQLHSALDEKSVDIIILCNVLHEIDPKDWLRLFSQNGILKSLKDNGKLLIVEDHQMSIGELAHSKGFLVLETLALRKMFAVKENDQGFKVLDHKGDGRLLAHIIDKEIITRITPETRISAIQAISNIAKVKIKELRTQQPNYKNGLKHGYWVQQLANAAIALEELQNS